MRASARPVLIVEPSGRISVDREALRETPEYKRQIEALMRLVRERRRRRSSPSGSHSADMA